MHRFYKTVFVLAAALAALLATACPGTNDNDGDTAVPGTGDFDVVIHYNPLTDETDLKLFSFSRGKEIPASQKNSAEWDIAMEHRAGFLYIHTNSGASAEDWGTAGQGGVWFADTTDYDAVSSLNNRVTGFSGDLADCEMYVTDVMRYQKAMNGNVGGVMNIMTYYGYRDTENYDGTSEEKAFQWSLPGPPSYPFYDFNKKAFAYVEGGMPPPWHETGQVYVVRHADGETYSKLQFYSVAYRSGYIYRVKFKFKTLEQ